MNPASPMPTTFDLWIPKIWATVVAVCAIFAAGADNSPDIVGQLKIPAGVVAVIGAIAAQYKAGANTKQAAAANPEHLASEDGHLDPAKTIGRLLSNAYEAGDMELFKALAAIPQQGGRR
jgi:hydroxymethylglutaryl-CoA reductase